MLDWDRICELRREVGPNDFVEVVQVFLEEVEDNLNLLEATTDAPAAEEILHLLKGAAWNLGFRQFGALCATGETHASVGQLEQVKANRFRDVYRDSRAAFLSGLAQRNITTEVA